MSNILPTEEYYAARAREYEGTTAYVKPSSAAVTAAIRARYQLELEGHDVLELACGPGYWTEAVSLTARSILATDRDPNLVSMVRERLVDKANVRCQVADAYTLTGVVGPFTAAFANFWWSHIPRADLQGFLATLHARLSPGALVMFMDDLRYYHGGERTVDADGNVIEERRLRNGTPYRIIKNFPSQAEVIGALGGCAEQIDYRPFAALGYWIVSYRTRISSSA